jgi:pyruvate formate lyase activating enzyme
MSDQNQTAGLIFQVQRWSLHDGEGIRSTVFLRGCPLRCAWCANPESWAEAGASQSQRMTVADLMRFLARDEVFYRESGGGITFSGGEPLSQPGFLRAALIAAGESGYHTAIETSAWADFGQVGDLFSLIDQVFVDLKHLDEHQHRQWTGQPNRRILDNIQWLLARHSNVVLRIPLIAGVNDQPEHLEAVAKFLAGSTVKGVEFMPYHNLGQGKYAALGLPAAPLFAAPSAACQAALKNLLRGRGVPVV